MKQVMFLKKETKGTFVYECRTEEEQTVAVTVIYIKKRAFATPPAQILITIEEHQ